jgi:anion-transporting  ArsA/GET3 family ATPase
MTGSARPLVDHDVVVVTGPPRSGSTTVAAALGLAAARRGRTVLVVTVDPSPDLVAAIGTVQPGTAARSGIEAAGELWVERFDVPSTFGRLVGSIGDGTSADVVGNPLYETLTASLPGAADFMALERLVQLAGEWELVVLDTHSSTPAGSFLTAPDRVRGFLGHPVYRALTLGQRTLGRVADAALSSFLGDVKKVAGEDVANDLVAFFRAISRLEPGLRDRLDAAVDLLDLPTTAFAVVTNVRPEAVADCAALVGRLEGRRGTVTAVANRVTDRADPLLERLWSDGNAGSTSTVPDMGIGGVDLAMLAHVGERLVGS